MTESRKSSISSRSDASFSGSAFAFFFVAFAAGFVFSVVCVNFLALVAAGFALAFGF
jgi:tetrahydromethanopterin S-methyltransferase subunit F